MPLPSHKHSEKSTLAGVLAIFKRKLAQDLDGQLPAKVISYDRIKNVAKVQPLIKVILTSGKVKSRAMIAAVPVLALGGGGFCVTFPLKAGDTGWIEASDRDISLFVKSLVESIPNTYRTHDFSDSRFIPDVFTKYTYSSADSADMVIQSLDGTTKINIGPSGIKLTHPVLISLNAPTVLKNGSSIKT